MDNLHLFYKYFIPDGILYVHRSLRLLPSNNVLESS